MVNYLKYLFIFLIIVASLGVKAQFNYKEGSIINLTNDTIFGLIKDVSEIKNSKVCRFKKDRKSKVVKYYPTDIKTYRFNGDKAYSAQKLLIKNEYKDLFFDILIEGDINLYYYRKYKNLSYFLQREGGKLTGLSNEYVTIGHPVTYRVLYTQGYNIEIQFYKDTLQAVFKDCKAIQKKIVDVEYDHKSLSNITKEYINLTCKGNDCITYERDLRISKPTFGVFTGIQFSRFIFMDTGLASEIESCNTSSYPLGFFYNIPLSLFLERFSFQIELIYRNLSYDPNFIKISNDIAYVNMESNVIGVPLLFKYEITSKKVSPTLAFGKEFGYVFNSKFQYLYKESYPDGVGVFLDVDNLVHRQQKGGWFFDLGVSYKMHPKTTLFSYFRFQRHYNLIIEDENSNNLNFNTVERKEFGKKYMTESASLHVGLRF